MNIKNAAVFEKNDNKNDNVSAKCSGIADKHLGCLGVKINQGFGNPYVPRTRFGQLGLSEIVLFAKAISRGINHAFNAMVKMAVIGIFLVLLGMYCQQNPVFAAQLNAVVNTVAEALKNAWDTVMGPLVHLFG
jgi:hypothetical protein